MDEDPETTKQIKINKNKTTTTRKPQNRILWEWLDGFSPPS